MIWQSVSIVTFRVLFLYDDQSVELLITYAETVPQLLCVRWNIDFATLCSLWWSLLYLRFLSAVEIQVILVLCYDKRFPFPSCPRRGILSPSCPWSVTILHRGRRWFFFIFVFFPDSFWTVFGVDDNLLQELGRNLVVVHDTLLRRLIELQRVLRCFQIDRSQSNMMILHDEDRTCSSCREFGSNVDTSHKYTDVQSMHVPQSLVLSPPILILNFQVWRDNSYVYLFSFFDTANADIYIYIYI